MAYVDNSHLVAKLDALRAQALVVLTAVRRECRPEFADRMEKYLRDNNLLPKRP